MHLNPEAKKRVASVIEKRQLKLAPIARKIGTSYSTLWNFVYGETENFGKIQPLADILEISLEWIQKGGDLPDPQKRFTDNTSTKHNVSEHIHKNVFHNSISLSVGIELAIKAALSGSKTPSEDTLNFVRESLFRIASGAKKPLTETEFVDYARGFLAMKK